MRVARQLAVAGNEIYRAVDLLGGRFNNIAFEIINQQNDICIDRGYVNNVLVFG